MNSSEMHFLSETLSAVNDGGDVVLYDTRGYTAKRITLLHGGELGTLIEWYLDGLCPVCRAHEINQGEVVCDSCFEAAQRFPARADALYKDPALEEHKALRRHGDLATPWYDK